MAALPSMEWIVTDDIAREAWRRLHEFANVELTLDYLARRNGVATTAATSKNYRKQAEQARVCVLQANEYFEAARSSSLYTSPNHLYYGLVALSSMQMLLLGDGTCSLDFRRKNPQNSNHGLRFTTGCNAASARTGLSLLESSYAEVLQHGHFLSWYSRLPKQVYLYGLFKAAIPDGEWTDFRVWGAYSVASPDSLLGRKHAALDLLQFFPDLGQDLRRYGVSVSAARTTHEVRSAADGSTRQLWIIHQLLDPSCRDDLLARFSTPPRFAEFLLPRYSPGNVVYGVEAFIPNDPDFSLRSPESRDTLDHETIMYSDPIDTHELVDSFLVAYQLSMLSRYYPDLWVACIESHCKASQLIEQAVAVLIKKTPILTLSMLSETGLTISTHRAPWK